MAEPGKAPVATPSNLPVTINANYDCVPKDGRVLAGGTVTFNVAPQGGCLIFTSPQDAFVGETNGSVTLNHGNHTLTINVPAGTTIDYCACATTETCNPLGIKLGGGNTIKVESQVGGGHR